MIFVSYAQAAQEVREWSDRLPNDIICVVGIPRSGAIIGTMLAHHRNICYADFHQIAGGEKPWELGHRRYISEQTRGKVLFVDDTVWRGRTSRQTQSACKRLQPDGVEFIWGSLYCNPESIKLAPHSGRAMPHIYHSFEWNIFHDVHCRKVCTDMDGVLCEDWGTKWGGTEREECGEKYLDFLENTRPLRIPSREVGAIITARLEKYRPQTEAWLERHGVKYIRLYMHPAKTKEERRGTVGKWKAECLAQIKAEHRLVYLDDNFHVCKQVAEYSRMPVLHYPSWQGWNTQQPGEWFARPTAETGLAPVPRVVPSHKKRLVN